MRQVDLSEACRPSPAAESAVSSLVHRRMAHSARARCSAAVMLSSVLVACVASLPSRPCTTASLSSPMSLILSAWHQQTCRAQQPGEAHDDGRALSEEDAFEATARAGRPLACQPLELGLELVRQLLEQLAQAEDLRRRRRPPGAGLRLVRLGACGEEVEHAEPALGELLARRAVPVHSGASVGKRGRQLLPPEGAVDATDPHVDGVGRLCRELLLAARHIGGDGGVPRPRHVGGQPLDDRVHGPSAASPACVRVFVQQRSRTPRVRVGWQLIRSRPTPALACVLVALTGLWLQREYGLRSGDSAPRNLAVVHPLRDRRAREFPTDEGYATYGAPVLFSPRENALF
eukprot:scaffold82838_cov56-Phaeocystis_antarctica.AAC.2